MIWADGFSFVLLVVYLHIYFTIFCFNMYIYRSRGYPQDGYCTMLNGSVYFARTRIELITFALRFHNLFFKNV
jgi:hypothetical protein